MQQDAKSICLARIVSGGQTGVDRAALDAAIELGIPHGGWCPRGRRAQDGRIPARYQLQETPSADYPERTERNVIDSDGTLILYRGPLSGGTALTRQMAQKHRKPCLVVNLDEAPDVLRVRQWLAGEQIRVLNVAGPRETKDLPVYQPARRFMLQLLSDRAPSGEPSGS